MLYRGIEVTYESIRKWCKKFAQAYYAHQIRRRRPKPADKLKKTIGFVPRVTNSEAMGRPRKH